MKIYLASKGAKDCKFNVSSDASLADLRAEIAARTDADSTCAIEYITPGFDSKVRFIDGEETWEQLKEWFRRNRQPAAVSLQVGGDADELDQMSISGQFIMMRELESQRGESALRPTPLWTLADHAQ